MNSLMNSENSVVFFPDEGGRYIVTIRTVEVGRTRSTTSMPSKVVAGRGVIEHRWNDVLNSMPTPRLFDLVAEDDGNRSRRG